MYWHLVYDPLLTNVKYKLMVGGFSSCESLQMAMKHAWEQKGLRVLVPAEQQLAVVKGATLLGSDIQNEDDIFTEIAKPQKL